MSSKSVRDGLLVTESTGECPVPQETAWKLGRTLWNFKELPKALYNLPEFPRKIPGVL